MTLKPIKNNIIFTFCDDFTHDKFSNRSLSGNILISSGAGDQTGVPRWGKVEFIGAQVLDIKVGEYICIDAGKWTTGLKFENKRYWRTDDTNVMMVDTVPHFFEL